MPKRPTKRKPAAKKPHGPRRIRKGESSYGKKKFVVRVRKPGGGVKTVKFGDPNMEIKRDSAKRRKNFRSRHNCANPGPRTKARYWSCRMWEKKKTVSDVTSRKKRKKR